MIEFSDIVLGWLHQAVSHNRDFAFEEGKSTFANRLLRVVTESDSVPSDYSFSVDLDEDGDIKIRDDDKELDIYVMSSSIASSIAFVPTESLLEESGKPLVAASLMQEIFDLRDLPPPSKWGLRVSAPVPMKKDAPEEAPCRLLERAFLSELGTQLRSVSDDDMSTEEIEARHRATSNGRTQIYRLRADNSKGAIEVSLDTRSAQTSPEVTYVDFTSSVLESLETWIGPLIQKLSDDESVDHDFLRTGRR